ncbi:MAG: sialidase family protein [Bryobacteraceae bacterium]
MWGRLQSARDFSPALLCVWILTATLAAQVSFPAKPIRKTDTQAELVSVDKVWEIGAHNAFTDLIRFRGRWFLAFREGASHISPDGAIRILVSSDAERWQPAAKLDYPVADLRDPKLTETPDGKLMLTTAGAMHPPSDVKFKTFVWFSGDGREWTPAEVIGDPEFWLWRVQWHRGRALSFGYGTGAEKTLRAYASTDGRKFQLLNPAVIDKDYPNETSVLFLPNEEALCLLRRDEGSKTALLGRSRPPYRGWTWEDLGVRIGGPHMLRFDDGRIVAAVRLYDGKARTSLCWLDPAANTLKEFLALPSGGDTSYAGLVNYQGLLYVSYYSTHEGRTSIYLAKVRIK